MTILVLVLFLYICQVYSTSVFPSKKWEENNKTASSAFRRGGVFLRLQALKPSPSPSPTHTGHDNTHEYQQLAAVNTSLPIRNNDATMPYKPSIDQQINRSVNITHQNNQPNLSKVDFVRPESFTKPTSIPPIGKFLEAPSPTSKIKPIESQLLRIKKTESFGPITEQFVAVDKVSRIEDLPKMPEIDSMDNIFKNEDIDNEFKKNIIDKTLFKIPYKGFITAKPIFTTKRQRKRKKKHSKFRTFLQSSKIPSFVRIKRHLWSRETVKNKDEILMIASYESNLNATQLKEKVENILLGKRQNKEKKVFIPPPPPIEMKSLKPFKKAKEIKDISKEAIQIDKQKPLEGIEKHLQTIDNQPEIKPISDHLLKNEPFKTVDDILDPIKPIKAMGSN